MKNFPLNTDARPSMDVPFEFLNAKLRGRRRRVYEGDQLRELARCASTEELAGRLYPRAVIADRLGLERRLRQDCVTELVRWTRYLSGDTARFYVALVRRFQIENIQVLLRLFAGGAEEPLPQQYLPELPEEMRVPSGELLASSELEEFVSRLPADLARAASPTLGLWRETGTTAFTEMALERAYWEGVIGACSALLPYDFSACLDPILCELNGARLIAVLRAARNYDIGWERLEPLLPMCEKGRTDRAPFHVGNNTLRELHADPSARNVTSKVRGISRAEDAENLVGLDEMLWERAFRLANRLYYGVTEGPAVLVGYFYVCRNELKNLTALIESIHYGKPFDVGHNKH